ncbi:hypothetical protein [Halomarina pelagica]|uniref:hypothetical protein n=1 Tax=Halomarina pelagica TaxID=2961599 RepID=UPI0020C1F774|nr:hypothetical protein [Halomarina sp. BND7]
MASSRSRIVVIATLLERCLKVSTHVGMRGALFVGSWFALYITAGVIGTVLGWFRPPFAFLSLDSDPFFVIGSALIGLFIVQSSSSLLLYHFLVGFEDEKSQFAVLMGFISLGFGGSLLRVILPTVIQISTIYL